MPRVPAHWLDPTGGSPGQAPRITSDGIEVAWEDVASDSIIGLTSTDSSVTITDNGDGTLDLSAPGGSEVRTAIFNISGPLSAGVGTTRLYNDTGADWIIESVRAVVETAPLGGPVTVDMNLVGTTVFTDQSHRPSIVSGDLTDRTTVIDVPTIPDGDYLTVDVDVASSPAANLSVIVVMTS